MLVLFHFSSSPLVAARSSFSVVPKHCSSPSNHAGYICWSGRSSVFWRSKCCSCSWGSTGLARPCGLYSTSWCCSCPGNGLLSPDGVLAAGTSSTTRSPSVTAGCRCTTSSTIHSSPWPAKRLRLWVSRKVSSPSRTLGLCAFTLRMTRNEDALARSLFGSCSIHLHLYGVV